MTALWLAASVTGTLLLLGAANRAGDEGDVPTDWPTGTALHLDPDRSMLLMFLHPKCPCSRASLSELARLMAGNESRLHAVAVFLQPREQDESWSHTSLWSSAQAISGASVVADLDGQEAVRFGARTSGHALLFTSDGRLLFSGGITAGRGHEGDNVGRTAITAILRGQAAGEKVSPVFGCDLHEPQRLCALEGQACHP